MSIAFQYHDAVSARLQDAGISLAKRNEAMAVLWIITRHLAWQSYECDKAAADLCDLTGIGRSAMSRCLDLLEGIGAIRRVKVGRLKIITVTPEGAFRGNVHEHGRTVERYRLEVLKSGDIAIVENPDWSRVERQSGGEATATPTPRSIAADAPK